MPRTVTTTHKGATLIAGALCGTFAAAAAQAGALDRSGQPVNVIFEDGNVLQFSLGYADPDVSGTQLGPFDPLAGLRALGANAPELGFEGAGSGDLTEDFFVPGFALKMDLRDNLSAAVIYDQPFGAGIAYDADTGFYLAGTIATVDTHALTGLLRYEFGSGFSVHGGARYQTYETRVAIPIVFAPPTPEAVGASIATGAPLELAGYDGRAERDGAWGFVVGGAYEIEPLALRVAVTYFSEVEHELDGEEVGPVPVSSTLAVTTPQAVNLDLQTGVAPGTLLFGGVRWVDWSSFAVAPEGYFAATGDDVVSYDRDAYTFTLGVGRQLTERFSGAVTVGYETRGDGFASPLGPTDGFLSLGLGGTYAAGPWELTAGASYAFLGDAESSLDDETAIASFEGNEAVTVGAEVAYRF